MTKGSEYRALAAERGMRGIQGPEGGELLYRLLGGRPARSSNILMTDNERQRFQVAVLLPTERTEEWRLDMQTDSWLGDHVVQGRPVYPACALIARMVEAARTSHGGAVAAAVEDCRFERPLAVRIGTARVCTRIGAANYVEAWIEADLRTQDGRIVQSGVRFASCRICFQPDGPPLSFIEPRIGGRNVLEIEDPYCRPESPLRLGPSFDCLEAIRVSAAANQAVLRVPLERCESLWHHAPIPMLVDGLLRLGSFHDDSDGLPIYMPAKIDRIVWTGAILNDESFELAAERPVIEGDRIRCARAAARDSDGRVMLEMHGYSGARLGRVSSTTAARGLAAAR
jgi:hypothetical protein